MKFLRHISLSVLLLLGISLQAQAAPDDTWFVGGSFFGFELNGSGTMSTFSSAKTEFNVKRVNAYGLVKDNVLTAESSLGLGWQDTQLPGFELQLGFRHNWQFSARLDLFWALTKRADQYGAPDLDAGTLSLTKQSTAFNQKHVRVLVDWTPFEPLSLWYVTGGVEYTEFSSRLEFQFERWVNDLPQERQYEAFEDSGSTFGVVLGTGLVVPGGGKNRQSYIQFSWSYTPYTNDWFAWDSDLNMGGLGFELGFRVFLPGDGE